ncbi:MAG: hypothetical protein ACKO0M_03640, partial [Cyanobium sp.]
LVIGLGNMAVIKRTHSLAVLSGRHRRSDQPGGRFVRLLDHYADALIEAMARAPDCRAAGAPWGVSVVCTDQATGSLQGYWIGQQERERQALHRLILQDRSCRLDQPLHFVVADAERNKATDILAGARALQFLCSAHDTGPPLLVPRPTPRTALLFNPCLESRNRGGVGNSGTWEHLEVLASSLREQLPRLRRQLGKITDGDELQRLLHQARQACLLRWRRHLRLVSDEDALFNGLRGQLEQILETRRSGSPVEAETIARTLSVELNRLLRSQAHPDSRHGQLLLDLQRLCDCGAHDLALASLNAALAEQSFRGLGEGGQRVLRLLQILQTFDHLVVATANAAVQTYLEELSPDLSASLHPALRQDSLISEPFRLDVLGMSWIDLRDSTASEALDRCHAAHRRLLPQDIELGMALIQEPVLLKAP